CDHDTRSTGLYHSGRVVWIGTRSDLRAGNQRHLAAAAEGYVLFRDRHRRPVRFASQQRVAALSEHRMLSVTSCERAFLGTALHTPVQGQLEVLHEAPIVVGGTA